MEIWKTIKGYEGRYLISNNGNIMSCQTGKLLSLTKDKDGYLIAKLYNANGIKYFCVHRLVARVFIPKPKGKNEINHINEIKSDNRVVNLEWVSHSENLIKYYENHKSLRKQRRKGTKYSQKRIIQMTLNGRKVNEWENVAKIQKTLYYNNWSIIQCCYNKRKQAYGYKWQFAIDDNGGRETT